MTYDVLGRGRLDYQLCRYGTSKLLFRGPQRTLDQPYLVFIGGTETFGKFIKVPFPQLVEDRLGIACVNLGQPNAGPEVFLRDPVIAWLSAEAQVTIVQVMGVQNVSNDFYQVHPRRNDRIIALHAPLRALFHDVDFADVHYTKHLLYHLYRVAPDRFTDLQDHLRETWLKQMRTLLMQANNQSVLLWFAGHEAPSGKTCRLDRDPFLVTEPMIAALTPYASAVVKAVATPAPRWAGTHGMVFSEMDAHAAAEMLPPLAHQDAAQELTRTLRQII